MRLSHKDFAALQQAIFELNEYRDLDRFRRETPGILLRLIPSEYSFWPEFTINPLANRQEFTGYIESSPVITPRLAQRLNGIIMKHPFTEYYLKGGKQMVLKISDFLTQTQFCNSEIYDAHREWGFRYTLGGVISASFGKIACLAFCDGKKDFSERDRTMLNLLRRHFDRAHHNAKLVTARLAKAVKPLSDYDLTPREIQVAHWLADGKTNSQIAIILQCSVRTIDKHVENILEKLGAENRVAAAVVIARTNWQPYSQIII